MPKTKKELLKKAAPAAKAAPVAKAAKKAAPAAKPMAKSAKKAEPKLKLEVVAKKGDKKSEKLELKAVEATEGQVNEEEEEDEAPASSGGASQSGLAMAAATADTASGSLKNFRHHPDIENFYRFIYENDLRYEGLEIIDRMSAQGLMHKSSKGARSAKM
jgi:hypothetical protein